MAEAPASVIAEGAFERRAGENPSNMRDAARALAGTIADQVADLNASKPNDERLAKHLELIAFLEWVAVELGKLADALDKAIAAGGATGPPEPIFLGKAGEIARHLNVGFMNWLERNREHIAGFTIRGGLFLSGLAFLHACGVGDAAATIASGILNGSFPRADAASKKKNHKRRKP